MSDTNAMVAEVLKALVARNTSKRAKGVLMPKPTETEAPSQENEISDEDMAALLEMGGEDEERMEA